MESVTLITAGAGSADTLTDGDYREIYDELRGKTTLRQFAEFIGSGVSFAWWSKYERGEAHLDRERRQELRRAVGLEELPRSVTEVTGTADADARIWQVGDGQPDRVVMVGRATHEPITMRLNGDLRILDEEDIQKRVVTGVTGSQRARNYRGLSVRRETWERLNVSRLRAGMTWDEFLLLLEEREGNAA